MDTFSDLTECVVRFSVMSYEGLVNINNNSTRQLCGAVETFQGCLYDDRLPPLAKLYVGHIANMSMSLMKLTCQALHEGKLLF